MDTILVDLCAHYLPTAIPTLSFGTNLFAGLLPDDPRIPIPDLCVAVYEYPGEAPLEVMGGASATGAPRVEIPHIQVEVRGVGEDYVVARSLSETVRNELCRVVNVTINGTAYQRIESIQAPFLVHRDETRRPYFMCNFRVHKDPAS